jgi:hypothetical protein
LPIDPCGHAIDVVTVCGYFKLKAWANRADTVRVRLYRVPLGTPALPIPHRFFHPMWDNSISSGRDLSGLKRMSVTVEPGEPGYPIGLAGKPEKYYKGAAPAGWRPPTHYIGTPEQWLEGSVFGVDEPLVWRGGFSEDCKRLCGPDQDTIPVGFACGEGCTECPLVSELWCVSDFEAFANLDEAIVVKREGCVFSTECVVTEKCPKGTAAAWVVDVDEFAGLTRAALPWRNGEWSSCCRGG